MSRYMLFSLLLAGMVLGSCTRSEVLVPVLEGEPWRICFAPDLDSLNGPDPSRQHVVDHGFIQADDGSWQLWACMRGTKVGRIFYGWSGESLTGPAFSDLGIVARADSSYGEQVLPEEKMQAPFFMKLDTTFLCFYNSNGFRLMSSQDGSHYRRIPFLNGSNLIFKQIGRDVMVMEEEGLYYAYSTVTTVSGDGFKQCFIVVRTSNDFRSWSDYTVVSSGGIAGNGPVSAESPFVLKFKGSYYLFRSSSITKKCYVYASESPYHFGINSDEKLVAVLPVQAPELVFDQGNWYISDLADFQGIMLYKLKWESR